MLHHDEGITLGPARDGVDDEGAGPAGDHEGGSTENLRPKSGDQISTRGNFSISHVRSHSIHGQQIPVNLSQPGLHILRRAT